MTAPRSLRRVATIGLLALAGATVATSVPPAATAGEPDTHVVNTTIDGFDGVCDEADCSLRDAIADAAPGGRVEVPGGFYTLNRTGSGGIGEGDIDVRRAIEIVATGEAGVFVDASALGERAFTLGSSAAANRYLLRGLTIFGARDPSIDGGAIALDGGTGALFDVTIVGSHGGDGGGIWSGPDTLLQVVGSLLLDNTAAGSGGAIDAHGDLLLNESTVAGNSATSGGGIRTAGGFSSVGTSTVAENVATGSGGGGHFRGAVTVSFSTVAGNLAGGPGGGVRHPASAPGEIRVEASIVSDNEASRGADCAGIVVSTGMNAGRAKGCGFDEPNDRTGLDPSLRRLGPFGGPTPTMALRPGSPAIDVAGSCHSTDQRGAPRGRRCDAGAYELVRCLGKPVNIVGTPGDDELSGGRGRDVFLGLGGDDEFQGSIGKDRACGGHGDDFLIAGPGNDRFDGQAGNDRLKGESGDDALWGGPGRDRLVGGPGRDTCQADRRDRDPRGCEILVVGLARRA